MNGGWVFLIILILVVVLGYGGWVAWSRFNANKLGLPPPSLNPFNRSGGDGSGSANYPGPAPTGIKGWFDAQLYKFKNRNNRYASGAYEEPSGYQGASRGGRGAGHSRLDPDEAWDARVGNEAYYEEQELGLHAPHNNIGNNNNNSYNNLQSPNPYSSNTSYVQPSPGFAPEPERGRSRTREYDESVDGRSMGTTNPFGDDNAASLRGVSPRPVDTSYGGAAGGNTQYKPAHKKAGSVDSAENSPTESRRSVFRENM